MFLVGGPAFSGTTLLALMLNQGDVVCLDEPDFHNPLQSHRSIRQLRRMFPKLSFPEHPGRTLTFSEATTLTEECEQVLRPRQLGTKTCNSFYLRYYRVYRRRGYPVIAIFRDIRDALVRPLPEGFTENGLNHHYRVLWQQRDMFNLWLRYEDLISDPDTAISRIAKVLGLPLVTKRSWQQTDLMHHMLKLDKHELLKTLELSASRVRIWRTSGKVFSGESHETARAMGY
jgi:hypothetical protein